MRALRRFTAMLVLVPVVFGVAACGGSDAGGGAAPAALLEVVALAGPLCPVESDPRKPECAPRPVEAATIVLTDPDGTELIRGLTDTDGIVTFEVTPGDLVIVPQPVEGLLGTAPPITVTVTGGQTMQLTADYDTGIR